MTPIILGRRDYRDKVHACWLGKNIGGTLGTPHEGRMFVHNLTFYQPVPEEPLPNDDLDLQLVWLQMLEEKGVSPRLPDFAEYWQRYACSYPWDEYDFCIRNLSRGLRPPVSDWFENYYVDEMGSPIRSEIWACLSPANPQAAAALAWMDSAMDHAGGEGMWGEMFWAAVESAAFVLTDPYELIRLGLAMIPPSCNIARVIREAVWCRQNNVLWGEARQRIATVFGSIQPCNAVPNHGFIILGWLYGQDFGDRLCKAVNCGYDTDCTGATLGSLLGILGGTDGIPRRWIAPVGLAIKTHRFTGAINAPGDVAELTDRTAALAEKFLAARSQTVAFGAKTRLSSEARGLLFRTEEAVDALGRDIRSSVAVDGDIQIILHYGGDPVLYPGLTRRMEVSLEGPGSAKNAHVAVKTPAGWRVKRVPSKNGFLFDITPGRLEPSNVLAVQAIPGRKRYAADFVVLGPEAARGFAAARNIEYCRTCGGTKGSCVCMRKQKPTPGDAG